MAWFACACHVSPIQAQPDDVHSDALGPNLQDTAPVGPFQFGPYTFRVLSLYWANIESWESGNAIHYPPVLELHYAIDGQGSEGSIKAQVFAEDQWGRQLRPVVGARDDVVCWSDITLPPQTIDPRPGRVKLEVQVFANEKVKYPNYKFRETMLFSPTRLSIFAGKLSRLAQPLPPVFTSTGIPLQIVAGAVADSKDGSGNRELTLVGRWLPVEGDPSPRLAIDWNPNPSVDFDDGEIVTAIFAPGKYGGEDREGYFTWKCKVPDDATAFTPSLNIENVLNAPPIAATLEAILPLPSPPTEAPVPGLGQTYAAALGAGRVLWQPLGVSANWAGRGYLFSQLIFDMPESQIDGTEWHCEKSESVLAGCDRQIGESDADYPDYPFRRYGPPLTPNQSVSRIDSMLGQFPWPSSSVTEVSKKITVSLTCRETKTSWYHLRFQAVPIPPAGEILSPDLTAETGDHETFVLRKVGYFNESQPLSGAIAKKLGEMQPPFGLVVVVERLSHDKSSGPVGNDFGSWFVTRKSGVDDKGTVLYSSSMYPDLPDEAPGTNDLAGPPQPSSGDFTTYYFPPPALAARTFDFKFDATRTECLARQVITIKDIPIQIPDWADGWNARANAPTEPWLWPPGQPRAPRALVTSGAISVQERDAQVGGKVLRHAISRLRHHFVKGSLIRHHGVRKTLFRQLKGR